MRRLTVLVVVGLLFLPSVFAQISCGNNVLEPGLGEECEGPNTVGIGGPFAGGCNDPLVPCNNGCVKDSECRTDCTCGPVCGDGLLSFGEPCDPTTDPSFWTCQPGETCFPPASEQPPPFPVQATAQCTCTREPIFPPNKNVKFGLFDLAILHNKMFAKSIDLLHISKDATFQAEIKEIEIGLRKAYTNPPNGNPCQVVPNLFMLTPSFSPYGKEFEIDASNNLLLFILNNPGLRFQAGVSDTQYTSAVSLQTLVNSNLAVGNFLTSSQAKCCLYNQFIVLSILQLDNGVCEIVPVCGNNIVEFPEECDDGNLIDCDGCDGDCTPTECGDGLVCNPPEECDDGNLIDGDGCEADCTNPFCDNGIIDAGEQCDPPPAGGLPEADTNCPFNVNGFQICGATCQCEECGNGIVDPGEECDDGNAVSEDGCSNVCDVEFCGDGITQTGLGEECDDGNADNTDGCTNFCELPECGDGFEQPGNGEQCDDGNNVDCDGCGATCLDEFCGDGIQCVSQSEQCDDGNNVDGDGCEADCTLPFCNNGIVDPPEVCDPPPAGGLPESDPVNCAGINGEVCDIDCECVECGNGEIDSGETCDDGNTDNNDGCNSNCQREFCGDGVAQTGEECGEPGLDECPNGKICRSCRRCGEPPSSSGSPQKSFEAACSDGGEYTIKAGQGAAYVLDVNGEKIELTASKGVTVGPTCCYDDCCNSFCKVGTVCLSPALDRNGQLLKTFLPVCRKPTPSDTQYCSSKGDVFCISSLERPFGTAGTCITEEVDGKKVSCCPKPTSPGADCNEAVRVFGVVDTPENPCLCMLLADVEKLEVTQPAKASGAAARLAGCEQNSDCTPGFVCRNSACVQRQQPAPKAVQTSFDNPVAIASIAVIVLALLAYMIFRTRPRTPKPESPAKPEPKPVEKPRSGYSPEQVESDLEALGKSYDKIEEMLKSMRRNFKNR